MNNSRNSEGDWPPGGSWPKFFGRHLVHYIVAVVVVNGGIALAEWMGASSEQSLAVMGCFTAAVFTVRIVRERRRVKAQKAEGIQ